MKPVYVVSTPKGQYICEIFVHPSAGFVWQDARGKRINYAIPTNMPSSKERLQFQVARSFNNTPVVLTEVK